MRAFFRSVIFGTLAAAVVPLFFTTLFAITLASVTPGEKNTEFDYLFLAILPLIVSFAFVFSAAFLIGLPTTVFLSAIRQESEGAYIAIGIIAGFLLAIGFLFINGGMYFWWIALLGAFSGAVTGKTWWTDARETVAYQYYGS